MRQTDITSGSGSPRPLDQVTFTFRNASPTENPSAATTPDIIRHLRANNSDAFTQLLPQLLEHGTHWINSHFRSEVRQAVERSLQGWSSGSQSSAIWDAIKIAGSLMRSGITIDQNPASPVLTERLLEITRSAAPAESTALLTSALSLGLMISPQLVSEFVTQGLKNSSHSSDLEDVARLVDVALSRSRLAPSLIEGDKKFAETFTSSVRWALDHCFSREGDDRLVILSRIASSLLKHGINTEPDPERPITTGRFIVELQRISLRDAAELTRRVIRIGYPLAESMTLYTLVESFSNARTIKDIKPAVRLAIDALDYKGLNPRSEKVIGCYNVILAMLTTPEPAHQRISRFYKPETDLFEVGRRLHLGLTVADAVMRSTMLFESSENQARMNMTIRGICTIGAALNLEAIRINENVDHATMRELKKTLGYSFDHILLSDRSAKRPATKIMVETLARGALNLAHQCAFTRGDSFNFSRVAERVHLAGSTINSVLTAIESTELKLNDFDALKICQTLEKGAALKQVRIKLFSRSINTAISEIYFAEGVSPIVRAYATARIATLPLHLGLDKRALERTRELLREVAPSQFSETRGQNSLLASLQQKLEPRKLKARQELVIETPREIDSGPNIPWFTQLLHRAGFSFNDSTANLHHSA